MDIIKTVYYIQRTELMKLNFCRFIRVMNVVIKRKFFLHLSQSTAEIKLLPVYQNGQLPYCNSISGFDFDLCGNRHTILHLPAKFRSN